MSQDIIIIDDAVSSEYQTHLENFCTSTNTPYYYQRYANYSEESIVNAFLQGSPIKKDDTFQFTHNLLINGEYSRYYPEFVPLFSSMPFSIEKMLRVKINMTVKSKIMENRKFSAPHIDFPELKDYYSAIYYVNDSDGDTFIFNETDKTLPVDSLTVKQQVSPKKGRLVIFNGQLLHAGNNPTGDDPRIVINMNLTKFKNKDNT
jgi:hypothetical protein